MNIPIVKEHGSWVVSGLSFGAGIAAGLLDSRAYPDSGVLLTALLTFAALAFFINTKRPLASILKRARAGKHLAWLLFFTVTGLLMMTPFLMRGFGSFVIFSPLVILYVILLYSGRERNLITELTGFSLLTLAAPVAYFVVSGTVSYRFYLALFLYFSAGVFQVRAQTRRDGFYRRLMVVYCSLCVSVYLFFDMPVIALLPLTENISSAIWPGELKLKTIGTLEFAKGIIFVAIIISVWK